ncbi:MAG: carboxypeptidase-like regulatory domain-containing protein, partial [Melioribacteraceae bacterium]|nr:carboxypeptidase-like regulatory domain-containing protein [Melioribacteraceae bacterium]
MNPFICSTDPDEAQKIISELEQLSEFIQFESLLITRLIGNRSALLIEDEDLIASLNKVVIAYLNQVTAQNPENSFKKQSENEDDILIIEPVSIVSGHNVEHSGEENFKVYNYYGRWAKCIVPDDDMFLPPNGDLLDVLRWNPLWEPSSRSFEMQIVPGEDPEEVLVYGLGYSQQGSPAWEELSIEEQNYVISAGILTVMIEFVPRIISVITNTSATFGKGKIASDKAVQLLSKVFTYTKILEKARLYISDGDYSGFYGEMRKEIMSLIANDPEFREQFLKLIGISLTESALKTLASYAIIPLKVLLVADDLTGLAKSVLALEKAQLKTTFKIYSTDFKFGNVNGNVYDEKTSTPIPGVIVKLLGDENNPMNPNYTYTTDANGGFWFENILTGTKSIVASKEEYGSKTIEFEVKEKETSEITIKLSKEQGTITGRVVNEIFINKGINPINFNKECHLDIKEIGGNNQSYPFWIYEYENGVYSKNLPPGTYEIRAWHEDYLEAVVTVSITGGETTQIEDLILKPDNKMSGSIQYDMNADNFTDVTYSYEADLTGG